MATIRFKFHLVDLKFAAWRLKHSGPGDEGVEALPDALEQSLASEPSLAGVVTPLPAGVPSSIAAGLASAEAGAFTKPENEAVEEGDATFRDLLARVTLAQGRLRFVAEVLQGEFASVQAVISALEKVEEQAQELANDTAAERTATLAKRLER